MKYNTGNLLASHPPLCSWKQPDRPCLPIQFQNLHSNPLIFLKSFWDSALNSVWDTNSSNSCKEAKAEGARHTAHRLRPPQDSCLWLLSSDFPCRHCIPLPTLHSRSVDEGKQGGDLSSSGYWYWYYWYDIKDTAGFPRRDCSQHAFKKNQAAKLFECSVCTESSRYMWFMKRRNENILIF